MPDLTVNLVSLGSGGLSVPGGASTPPLAATAGLPNALAGLVDAADEQAGTEAAPPCALPPPPFDAVVRFQRAMAGAGPDAGVPRPTDVRGVSAAPPDKARPQPAEIPQVDAPRADWPTPFVPQMEQPLPAAPRVAAPVPATPLAHMDAPISTVPADTPFPAAPQVEQPLPTVPLAYMDAPISTVPADAPFPAAPQVAAPLPTVSPVNTPSPATPLANMDALSPTVPADAPVPAAPQVAAPLPTLPRVDTPFPATPQMGQSLPAMPPADAPVPVAPSPSDSAVRFQRVLADAAPTGEISLASDGVLSASDGVLSRGAAATPRTSVGFDAPSPAAPPHVDAPLPAVPQSEEPAAPHDVPFALGQPPLEVLLASTPSSTLVGAAVPAEAAAASARTETLAVTVSNIAEAVATQILVTPALAQGEGTVRLVLKPNVLDGAVVTLTAQEGTLTVTLTPPTPKAAAIAAAALPQLEVALASHAPAFHHVAVVLTSARKGLSNETT